MKLVLDTSVILSGKDIPLSEDIYIPPSILTEIKKGGRWYHKLQRMRAAGLTVVSPPGNVIQEVKKQARQTGDYLRLSKTDIEVIGLALQLNATILTDDYSIQNLAKSLGINFKGISQKEIEEEYKWRYKCVKCGRWFKEAKEECHICGGKIKTVRLTHYEGE
ncbi:MAG: NOB1 family endonuclease [Thermoplasmatota archaeon]